MIDYEAWRRLMWEDVPDENPTSYLDFSVKELSADNDYNRQ